MALVAIRGLSLALPDRAAKPLFGRVPTREILRDINLDIDGGECLGIVGESGSGKTTLGRTLLRLYEPTAGTIHFAGQDITHMAESELRPLRARMQMAFQDPQSSLNPRHRIEDILAQPLLAFAKVKDRNEGRREAIALLNRVGLPSEFCGRYPHELSGGQRQRVGIARAIALQPQFIVADEIVSGLDVSTKAQILTLLREIKPENDQALMFISHDLSVVRVLCDRVAVMYQGKIVELGACESVFASPQHPYTRELLSAIPLPDVDANWVMRESVSAE
jgi:peptide/nickel transport system ATP-binding protein